jgi:hypothetical protein
VSDCQRLGYEGEWGLTANECRVSLGADENILKLAVMHAQHCEYATKTNWIIDFEGSILCYMTMLLLKKRPK